MGDEKELGLDQLEIENNEMFASRGDAVTNHYASGKKSKRCHCEQVHE